MIEGVDWCQGKIELAQWLRKRKPDTSHSGCGTHPSRGGSADALSATADRSHLGAPRRRGLRTLVDKPDCVDWLLSRPPDQIIAETIFVYEVLPR